MKNSSVTLKTILILLCLSAGYIINAQTSPPCAFQSLFTFEPGMNKMVVMDSINKTYKLKVVSRKTENVKSTTDGNPIVKEVVAYKLMGVPALRVITVSYSWNLRMINCIRLISAQCIQKVHIVN